MSNSFTKIAVAAVFTALVSGCASGPDLGDTISARGDQATQIAKDFKRGESLVSKGERNVRKGNKLTDKGQDQIRNGQALQEKARRQFCDDVGNADPVCQ